ncbi:MAG: hypothetical protein ACREHD_17920, partial [Pirellulales bacterium]
PVAGVAGSGADNIHTLGAASSTLTTQVYSGNLAPQPMDPNLVFPGGLLDPGNRNSPLPEENHGISTTAGGATVITYSFPDVYGDDPTTGAPLHNQITANEEETVRELFKLYSYYTGLTFVEAPGNTGEDWVVVGDTRVLNQTLTANQVDGISSNLTYTRINGTVGGLAIINGNFDWGTALLGQSTASGNYFTGVAMHGIGLTLGLEYDDDGPPGTIMGNGVNTIGASNGLIPAQSFPGLDDITNLLFGYEPNSDQIDLYQFNVDSTGTFTAETLAQRLAEQTTIAFPADQPGKPAASTVNSFSLTTDSFGLVTFTQGDNFLLSDGTKSLTFEFDDTDSADPTTGLLPDGNVAVEFKATDTQAQLVTDAFNAIQAQVTAGNLSLNMTAGAGQLIFTGSVYASAANAKELSVATPGGLNSLLTLYEEFQQLTLPASGALVNTGVSPDTFTITDNSNTFTFQFTDTPSAINSTTGLLADGNFGVAFSSSSTQQDLAVSIVAAVDNAVRGGLNASATLGSGSVQLGGPITVNTAGAAEISAAPVQQMIAQNDDYFGKDSFIDTSLSPGVYYVAVTASGNDQFNPDVPDSGWGGQSYGQYQIKLGFQPAATQALTDPGQSLLVPSGGASAIQNKYSITLTDNAASTGQVTLNSVAPTPVLGATLAAGTYYYVVTAVDASGHETIASNELSGTLSAPGALKLSWTASSLPNLAHYNVYRSTVKGAETLLASVATGHLTFTDDGNFAPPTLKPASA